MLKLQLTETRVANKEPVGSFNAVDVEQAQRRVSAASAKKYSASAGPSKAATKASEKSRRQAQISGNASGQTSRRQWCSGSHFASC